ncbi:MAG: PKD domain-containing protein, partial [bacterium]
MTPEQILSHPAKVLSQEQREDYFDLGYVKVEELIPKNTLVELRRVIDKVWDASREETQSGTVFDLGPGHSPQKPVLRRLKKPDEYDQVFWDFGDSSFGSGMEITQNYINAGDYLVTMIVENDSACVDTS